MRTVEPPKTVKTKARGRFSEKSAQLRRVCFGIQDRLAGNTSRSCFGTPSFDWLSTSIDSIPPPPAMVAAVLQNTERTIMTDSKAPSPWDMLIGARVRRRRRELKMTQEELGDLLEVRFQQVQKYEKGVNRISSGRLYLISHVMRTPIMYFYADMPDYELDDVITEPPSVLTEDEERLVRSFQNIESRELQSNIVQLTRHIASEVGKRQAEQGSDRASG